MTEPPRATDTKIARMRTHWCFRLSSRLSSSRRHLVFLIFSTSGWFQDRRNLTRMLTWMGLHLHESISVYILPSYCCRFYILFTFLSLILFQMSWSVIARSLEAKVLLKQFCLVFFDWIGHPIGHQSSKLLLLLLTFLLSCICPTSMFVT